MVKSWTGFLNNLSSLKVPTMIIESLITEESGSFHTDDTYFLIPLCWHYENTGMLHITWNEIKCNQLSKDM